MGQLVLLFVGDKDVLKLLGPGTSAETRRAASASFGGG